MKPQITTPHDTLMTTPDDSTDDKARLQHQTTTPDDSTDGKARLQHQTTTPDENTR
jgi:hypothetical protein